jgi:hypothetical protein
MAGAQLVNYSPISIAIDGMGLNVTGFSYNGTMWICAVSCRQMMPDPAVFADCLRSSFAELKSAAERHAAQLARKTVAVVARAKPPAKAARPAAAKPRARAKPSRKTGPRRRRKAAVAPQA